MLFGSGFNFFDQLSFLGELPRLFLGVEQFVSQRHFEDAPGGPDEFRVQPRFSFDRVRQTGGSGAVVSDPAVFDGNFHALLLALGH